MSNPRHHRPAQRGLSLVEATIVLAITAIGAGAAVPGWQKAREKRHLDGIAAQLGTDIRYGRAMAVARQQSLRMSFVQGAAGSCYVLHTGAAADCSCAPDGSARCRAGAQALHVAGFPAQGPVQVVSNSASMLFDADRGTVTPTATVRVLAGGGPAVHQVVSIMGRTRACTPNAAAGYPAC